MEKYVENTMSSHERYTRMTLDECLEVRTSNFTKSENCWERIGVTHPFYKAILRLYLLEEELEQKTFIEFPVEIGTDVYRITKCKCKCTYGQNNCGFMKDCPRTSSKALAIKNLGVRRCHQECAKIVPGKFRIDDVENYNETVFTDFNDALKALEKMESREQSASVKILKYPGCKFTLNEKEKTYE